jgi:phosphatidylinositol alpha-1,6-mannosyltransferase
VPSPTLVAITLTAGGDGVAVVARMLRDALQSRTPSGCEIVSMFDGPARHPSVRDKIAFTGRLSRDILIRRPRWVFFSHIGLMRAQKGIPFTFRRPYGVFLHGVEAWKRLSPTDRSMLRGASLRLANTQHTAARVMAANPEIGVVASCPLALTTEIASAPMIAGSELPPALADRTAQIVLMVGGLRGDQAYKGHDQVIQAWPAVIDAVPNSRLVIVGDGDDRPRLERLARESGAGDRIAFTGFASDALLATAYARASLFVMPSRGEGFGLVYVEAMARGVPCIGSLHDAAGDVIVDGKTGLLVDQGNIGSIADAIVSLLRNPERRRSMGEAARMRVHEEFSTPAFRARLNTILDQAFE